MSLDILEKNENFRLAIDPSSLPDNVTISVPNRAKVKIVDDDGRYRDKINIICDCYHVKNRVHPYYST